MCIVYKAWLIIIYEVGIPPDSSPVRLVIEAFAQGSGSPSQTRCSQACQGGSMRGLSTALYRRSFCLGLKFFIANAVFLGLLRWEYARPGHYLLPGPLPVRSLPRAQVLYCKYGVFGLFKQEYTVAGYSFMWVRSLLRAQVLRYKRGIFGPVLVGVYKGRVLPFTGKGLTYLLDSPSQTWYFWACCGGSIRWPGITSYR